MAAEKDYTRLGLFLILATVVVLVTAMAVRWEDRNFYLAQWFEDLYPEDEVIVCLPIKSQFDRIVDIVKCCEEQGITVRVAADILADSPNLISAQQLGANTLLSLHPHAINGAGAATKRLIDILGSALLIVALSPLLVVAAIVVMLSSTGPIFAAGGRPPTTPGATRRRFWSATGSTPAPWICASSSVTSTSCES